MFPLKPYFVIYIIYRIKSLLQACYFIAHVMSLLQIKIEILSKFKALESLLAITL